MNRLNVKGFSIIEFMIAISLGALLIASAASIYLSGKRTFNSQYGLARLQENARYANFRINQDIRMAGFLGCGNQNSVEITNRIKNPSQILSSTQPIKGYDATNGSFSPSLPSNLSANALAGSDVLEIRMGSSEDALLSSNMNLTNNPIAVHDRLTINAGDILMISNCQVGDVFVAGSNSNSVVITHAANENTSNDLSVAYTTDANVMKYLYYAYYVKNTGRTNASNEPILALMRQDVSGNEDEIAEGVEQMQVRYGVDTNSDRAADQYQTATEVEAGNNWDNVISVNMRLLFATTGNVSTEAQPYTFNGTTTTPSDTKLRREWNSFITLRNRGLPGSPLLAGAAE